MAKLSKTGTTILWRLERKTQERDLTERIETYAMRSDGVLLSKLVVELHDGRHNYGWKVATKKPHPEAKTRLQERGFAP